jgi:hypothetical protein
MLVAITDIYYFINVYIDSVVAVIMTLAPSAKAGFNGRRPDSDEF